MKTRSDYVSNSSSSSFIIYNWAQVPDDKKRMILDYRKYAVEEWERLGVRLLKERGFVHPDYRNSGDAPCDGPIGPDGRIDIDSEYDFGWVENEIAWRFRETPEDGILDMATSMDNFDMEKWMDHIGGFKYRWTGENWGYFSDEEIKFAEGGLERLMELAGKKKDE